MLLPIRPRSRATGWRSFQNLEKNLIAPDHAQFIACTFFNRLQPLLQITHFGIQGCVAGLHPAVGFTLRLDLPLHFPYAQQTALAEISAQLVKSAAPGIVRRITEILLDAEQLVVLGQAIGP